MPRIALPEGAGVHCIVDDFLWPWDASTPVLMMHGCYGHGVNLLQAERCSRAALEFWGSIVQRPAAIRP
ncbi:MAG TPA: hypothetical protein VGS13_04850 [Stellaceae bacterium]|nr:hypothetical protein [Stellaceae bacterium]